MLSLFPDLLFLAPVSAALIRATLAIVVACAAWKHFSHLSIAQRLLGIAEIVLAALLLVGAWTQAIALASLALFIFLALARKMRPLPHSTLLLAIPLCVSLLITGPGIFALDLPL